MRFSVPADHPCLPGHFPGRPLVPGVVILDAVLAAIQAQTGAPLQALRLDRIKFVQPLLPEQQAEIALDGADPAWTFTVHHAGVLLASGSVRRAEAG